MRPAFSSTKQAAAFGLLLLALLLSPVLAGKRFLPSREAAYSTASLNLGCFPFIIPQIYQEKGDIDIAFIGSSHIWHGIDTPYVQDELSKKLGRKATVLTLGFNFPGFDSLYFITKDLLAHRKVHMLVFYDECSVNPIPQKAASIWFRFGEDWDELSGTSLGCKAAYYAEAVRGMPRNFLTLIHPTLPVEWRPAELGTPLELEILKHYYEAGTPQRLGSLSLPMGFTTSRGVQSDFVELAGGSQVPPGQVCLYSPETKDLFQFAGPKPPEADLFFAKKIAALAQSNSVKLVMLHMPLMTEAHASTIAERECWPEELPGSVTLMGVRPAAFTSGINGQDIATLFFNEAHLNKNGQEYFTRAITPTLLDLYERQTPH
jgi:hypothetical protein